jgi:hypothetical protein
VDYSILFQFVWLQGLIKTTKDEKEKRNENYSLRKKVPVVLLWRISKRLYGGDV